MDKPIYFTVEKETKGAVRYKECNEDRTDVFAPVIGSLYIRKSAMPGRVIPNLMIVIKERTVP